MAIATTVTVETNIDAIRELLRANPRTTFDEVEEKFGLSRDILPKISREELSVQKKFRHFVPHQLTAEQKQTRLDMCRQNHSMWKNEGQKLIDKIITWDENYVHS
uniref:Uncharacterized protein n=1 Tax=Plectus sambesii TaxID=2011161 RepID=A0A914UQW0_9BILA